MPTYKEASLLTGIDNMEGLLWGIVIAGCYDRRKRQCEKDGDAEMIEAWEKCAAEYKEKHVTDSK